MAIVVDKIQKRKDIALSCKELFLANGIKNVTISQLAKAAGVGKGTIYDYFENKEDMILEIANIMIHEYDVKRERKLSKLTSTKEKIKTFFEFFYTDETADLRELYKESISILLINYHEKMVDFKTARVQNIHQWIEQILQEGVDKGEIVPQSLQLTKSLVATSEGFFIASVATKAITDYQKELHMYLDTLFTLIEVKQ